MNVYLCCNIKNLKVEMYKYTTMGVLGILWRQIYSYKLTSLYS
jgi:hypothetical protein